jgi:hypothetical protein
MKKSLNDKIQERFNQRQREAMDRMRRKRIYVVGDKDTLKARHDYEEEGRLSLERS